jgi:hypothetical protein
MNDRVSITTRCRPDYTRPEKDAATYGFILEYGEERIEFWATDLKDYFWRVAMKHYDYHRVYVDFLVMAKGRSTVSKLIRPAFKFAEANRQMIFVNGVCCTLLLETPVAAAEDESAHCAVQTSFEIEERT